MRFEPKTEEQIRNIWKEGVYKFKVDSAQDYLSSAKNEMILLDLIVFNEQSNTSKNIKCYLGLDHIIKHFCDATGLEEQYKSGEIQPTHCRGKEGYLILKVGEYKGDPKNEVKDFVKQGANQQQVEDKEALNDPIPF